MKKTNKTIKKKVINYSLFFFFMLIILISNIFYAKAMDQHLEIRMLALSLFLGLFSIPLIINTKKNIVNLSDISIIKNPVVIIYSLLIIILGISIFWATNKSEAMYEFLKRTSFFILFLYLILFVFPQENSRLSLIKIFTIFSLIISFIGIFQIINVLSKSTFNIESLYKITGNFAQKNIFSEVLFITVSFSFYGIFSLEKFWKSAAIIGSLLSFLLIILLMTRAIWVAFFISSIFTFFLFILYANKGEKSDKLKKLTKTALIIIGIAIISVVFITVIDNNKTIQNQLTNATNFKEGNTYHRINLWKKTLSLATENPIIGVGAGNWRIEILKYDLQVFTEKGRIMPDRAHNDFLQIFAENGIIGLLAFTLIFIFLIYYSIVILKKSENFKDKLFILILFFVIVGYMIDSLFAFPRERIELQIFLNIIFSAIVYEYFKKSNKEIDNKQKDNKLSIKIYAVIFLILSSITSYASYKRLQAEIGITKIYENNNKGNHDEIIRITDEIYSVFSTITPFGDPIMDIKATSLYIKKYDLNLVLETFDKSQKDSPYHLKTFNDLSTIYFYLKDYKKALEYCNKALKYSPTDAQTKLIIVKILIAENKIDEAYNTLRSIKLNFNSKALADYKENVNFILYNYKLNDFVSTIKNQEFKEKLNLATNIQDFIYNTYMKSISKNESFEKTLLEAILPICNKAKIINDESIKQIILKYKT